MQRLYQERGGGGGVQLVCKVNQVFARKAVRFKEEKFVHACGDQGRETGNYTKTDRHTKIVYATDREKGREMEGRIERKRGSETQKD